MDLELHSMTLIPRVNKGLSIGVFVMDGKPTILINWGESQREGAAFSSDLVHLAKVINDAGR